MSDLAFELTKDNTLIIYWKGDPKIRVSYINYITQRELNFEDKNERKDKSIVYMILKDKKYRIPMIEFENTYFDFFKEAKLSALPTEMIKDLISSEFFIELKTALYFNSIRMNITDCWWLFNFDYHLKYIESLKENINYTPLKTITVLDYKKDETGNIIFDKNGNAETIIKERDNKYFNVYHNFYELFNLNATSQQDIRNLKHYIKEYYEVSMPTQRWQFINLIYDYMLAGLFKRQMFCGEFGQIKYPILLITGQPGLGKTTTIQHILKLFYQKDSDFKFNISDISGASPLTRLKLSNNSVLPILLDEVPELNTLAKVINNYLTEGCLVDKTTIDKEQKTRKCHYNLILATNAIKLEQYGSDAIVERFVNYELDQPVEGTAEISKKYQDFCMRYKDSIQSFGRALFYILRQYEIPLKEYINNYLKQYDSLFDHINQRNFEKTKFLVIGQCIRTFLNTTQELEGAFKQDNNIEYYNALVNGTMNKARVVTRNTKIQDAIIALIHKSIKHAGRNVYLAQIFNDKLYHDFYINDTIVKDVDDKYQVILKYLYFFDNELGIVPTTEYGYFLLKRQFFKLLSSEMSDDSPIVISDFRKKFDKYIKNNKATSINYYNIFLDENEKKYLYDIKKTTSATKFNLYQYLLDWEEDKQ